MVERIQKTAFLFPGQGSQYVGMGKDFYTHFKEAREIFNQANEILGFDIASLCFHGKQEELNPKPKIDFRSNNKQVKVMKPFSKKT